MLYLLALFILCLPLNLFYKLSAENSFVNGLQIDYLISKLYLTDIFLAAILLLWLGIFFWNHRSQNLTNLLLTKTKNLRSNLYFWSALMLVAALVIRQVTTARPLIAFFFLFNLAMTGLLAFFLSRNQKLIKSKLITFAIAGSFLLQFSLGLCQFITQRTLLNYRYLGEPSFAPYYRLSRQIFSGQEKILAYGSTAHPNILASTIVIFFLILASRLNPFSKTKTGQRSRVILVGFFILALINLYITQARSAVMTLILGSMFLWKKQFNFNLASKLQKIILLAIMVMVPILLAVMVQTHTYQPSISRRHWLNTTAIKMIIDQPFLGQGLNHFTVFAERFSTSPEVVRFIQPAHHVSLLLLAEAGLLGVLVIIFLFQLFRKQKQQRVITALLILSPILSTDHFFYSLQPGRLLLVFFYLLFLSNVS